MVIEEPLTGGSVDRAGAERAAADPLRAQRGPLRDGVVD